MRNGALNGFGGAVLCLVLPVASGCSTPAAAAKPGPAAPIPVVQTALAGTSVVTETMPVTGTLTADRTTVVAAEAAGRVLAVNFELGDGVEAGQRLLLLDSRAAALGHAEAGAQLSRLVAERDSALSDCERARVLFASGALSPADRDHAEARCASSELSVQAAQARVGLSQRGLSDTVVRAPLTAHVAERSVEVGDYVTPGRPLATLVDTRSLRLDLAVPQSVPSDLERGSSLACRVVGRRETEFHATVERASPLLDDRSRERRVQARVTPTRAAERPGALAVCSVPTGTRDAASVPASALFGAPESRRVFVVRAGELEERVVQAGDETAGTVAILRGVAPGEAVALAPRAEWRDGTRVREEAQPSATPAPAAPGAKE